MEVRTIENSNSLFKGYVLTSNKKCIERFKGREDFKTLDEVSRYPEYAGILAENTVLVDIDDGKQSEILLRLVRDHKISCRVIRTTRGMHFYFHNDGRIHGNKTGTKLFIGLTADIKLGSRNSYAVLKFNDREREVVYDHVDESGEYETVPKYLCPTGKDNSFLEMEAGDGRNQELFNYILHLQSNDFSKSEARECLRLINAYVLVDPLGGDELETILRDESFQKPQFFKGGQFLFFDFATFLKNNRSIKKINGRLHIYKDGIYVSGLDELERAMIQIIPTLNKTKRKEVFEYIKLIVDENTRTSGADYISFRNGVYHLESKSLMPFSEEIVLQNKIMWDYNPHAYDELTDKTLNKLACGDEDIRALMEEMIGYCLYTRNELGKAFILIGDKSNGKSTLLAQIQYLLGADNIASLDLNELGERFKTAELFGKLANIGDDIGDEFIANTAIFRKLVTGDRVNVEKKGEDPFEFNNYSKFIFSANKIPRIKDKTGATQRRLVIIPFNAKFSVEDEDFDPEIKYKLKTQAGMEYLIKIGLEGLERVLSNKRFTKSVKVEEELDKYEKSNNPVLLFFEEVGEDGIVNESVSDVYRNYGLFCADNGLQKLSKIEFGRMVTQTFRAESKTIRVGSDVVRVYIQG